MKLTQEEELRYGFRALFNNFAPMDKWKTEKERRKPIQDGTVNEVEDDLSV